MAVEWVECVVRQGSIVVVIKLMRTVQVEAGIMAFSDKITLEVTALVEHMVGTADHSSLASTTEPVSITTSMLSMTMPS